MNRKRLNFIGVLLFVVVFVSSILPSTKALAANNPPKLNGKAAASIDLSTGEIIYALNMDEKMYPASMTKLMTALLLAENKSKSDLLKYTESARKQPQYSLFTDIMRKIKVGDTMSAEDVMKALLLFSANDSAYMIADNVAGSADAFQKMMNDRAAKLGMKGSNFVSPNGLHDPEHYTTPYDMLLLMKEAYSNPWVKEVMGIQKDTIRTTSGIIAHVENRNKLLGKNGNVGGKTGYTSPAGRCLVSIYERDGRAIAAVVMKSAYGPQDMEVFDDMEAVVDYSFAQKRTPVQQKDTVIKTETITYKPFKFFGPEKSVQVPVILKDEVSYYENDVNKKELKTDYTISPMDAWKLTKETKVGTFSVQQRGYTKTFDLYPNLSTDEIKASNKGLYIFTSGAAVSSLLVILLVVLLIRKSFRKKNRRYRY